MMRFQSGSIIFVTLNPAQDRGQAQRKENQEYRAKDYACPDEHSLYNVHEILNHGLAFLRLARISAATIKPTVQIVPAIKITPAAMLSVSSVMAWPS
jgi:hypothetical protein